MDHTMINSFDRWLREMAGMERQICREKKKDTEQKPEDTVNGSGKTFPCSSRGIPSSGIKKGK